MKKKILFAASECVPFIKTGGLADVVGSLPKYFDHEKYDVRVVLPKYACIKAGTIDGAVKVGGFYTGFVFREQYVGIWELKKDDVTFYFLENDFYFNGPWPYTNALEDIEKFSFFSKMVLAILKHVDFKPDVIHCHDWQAGLVPVYLNDSFQADLFYKNIKTVFTIHNLKFQGKYGVPQMMEITGLSAYYFTPDKLEAYQDGNMLKGGLVYSDRITTVSSTYAEEIQTPFYGEQLDGLLRARNNVLSGIVNGIDTGFYDPANDPDIYKCFSVKTALKGKAFNKAALQKELGLKEDPNAFMIGICSRLTDQKGFDLVDCVMNEICDTNAQIVILGTGDASYENMFRYFASRYPDRVSAQIYYSEAFSHKLYAACDAFLMPSLFEPCGLSQLMSLRYGTLPIVRETGGLKDTVMPYNEFTKEGTGFSFTNYNAHEMLGIIRYAKSVYDNNRKDWDDMVIRAMEQDFSWNSSAKKYAALYEELIDERMKEETPVDL